MSGHFQGSVTGGAFEERGTLDKYRIYKFTSFQNALERLVAPKIFKIFFIWRSLLTSIFYLWCSGAGGGFEMSGADRRFLMPHPYQSRKFNKVPPFVAKLSFLLFRSLALLIYPCGYESKSNLAVPLMRTVSDQKAFSYRGTKCGTSLTT